MKRRRRRLWLLLALLVSPAVAQTPIAGTRCNAVAVATGQVFEALPRETLSMPFPAIDH